MAFPSGNRIGLVRVGALFVFTAIAEILGCYLPWLVIRQERPVWLWLPAFASLGLFAWLLTLHPAAAGRTYAAYGGYTSLWPWAGSLWSNA